MIIRASKKGDVLCTLNRSRLSFQRRDTWLELWPQRAGACIAVGQAFQPDCSGRQARKPDLLKDPVV